MKKFERFDGVFSEWFNNRKCGIQKELYNFMFFYFLTCK